MLSRRGTITKGTSHSEWHQGAARTSKRYNIFYYRDIKSVQNSVPYFVFKTKKFDRITPTWLPVRCRIVS